MVSLLREILAESSVELKETVCSINLVLIEAFAPEPFPPEIEMVGSET